MTLIGGNSVNSLPGGAVERPFVASAQDVAFSWLVLHKVLCRL
jgi:hypothetical protein